MSQISKNTINRIVYWFTVLFFFFAFASPLASRGSNKSGEIRYTLKDYISNKSFPQDYWMIESPENTGLDGQKLNSALAYCDAQNLEIHSFLIIRKGKLVFERYGIDKSTALWRQILPNELHPMYSTTKSVTSALIGIAINQGIISSITDRVLPYFTNFSPAFCGTLKSNISIEDVLTMRSGLTWNEDRDESLSWMNYDPVHFVLNKPMAAPPGTVWNYSTGSAHILTSLLARKLRTNVASWANENLFTPIAIKRFRWDKNQNYVPQGGKGLFLTSRDMAKFGWLYLNKGCWEGKQVVPTNWVEASTAKHSETPWFGDYGYLWWINKSGGFSTQGAFGQSIFVYPDKELVVVFTANLPVETASIQLENIVKSYVLTAINK